MPETKNILTNQQVREFTRVDPDYPETLVSFASASATSYIDKKTDHQWEKDEPIDQEAQECARLVVEQSFFHDESHNFNQAIFDYIEELKLRAKEE